MPIARRDPIAPDAPNSGAVLPPEATQTDAQGRKFVVWPDGRKFYLLPGPGSPLYFKDSNGGLIHKPDTWNPQTGQWDPGGVDWGKLGPWLGLAAIGGEVAYAALSSSVPAAAVSSSAASTGTAAGTTAATTTAAGTGGTLAATSTAPAVGTLATGTVASGAVPAATAAGTGGTVAATTAPKVGSLGWANLIGGVTQLGGAYLQSRATGKASDAELQAQREALDFLKERDKRDYADQAPYRALGANAANSLGHYLGMPAAPTAPTGNSLDDLLAGGAKTRPPDAPVVGVAMPRGADASQQLVTMRDTTGAEKQVPARDVMRLLSMGATIAQPTTPPLGARTGAM